LCYCVSAHLCVAAYLSQPSYLEASSKKGAVQAAPAYQSVKQSPQIILREEVPVPVPVPVAPAKPSYVIPIPIVSLIPFGFSQGGNKGGHHH
jgi:hypothetical protein